MADDTIHGMLSRIDERTENMQHRVRNLEMKLDAYATQRDLNSANMRIEKLENNQTWVTRAVIGAWISGSAIFLYIKSKF